MEEKLFTYKEYDILDEGEYQFTDCVLKIDIGKFKAGSVIDFIVINYSNGKIQFLVDEEIADFKLGLVIL